MAGPSDFNFETFKKEIKDDMCQMVRDMFIEMKEKRLIKEENTKTRTVLGEPPKEKSKTPADSTEPEWAKDMKRQMNQLQATMKSHRLNPDFANVDLNLGRKEPLPLKY